MRLLYALSDEKFVKKPISDRPVGPLDNYQFQLHPFIKGKAPFKKNDVPIEFKATPDTLLNLCAVVIDALPLPPVYKWTNVDVCVWIRKFGYPQYMNTFRENMINGRTLLLLDAAALSAMNIKNFDDIVHIARGIRGLFFFELTKFMRSISLAPHYHYELYKLYRVKSGLKYEQVKRTDLWRKMQLLREMSQNDRHWELLEKWLSLKPDPIFQELFGGFPRYNIYKCKRQIEPPPPPPPPANEYCSCLLPCDCYWTEKNLRPPWRLKVLQPEEEMNEYKGCTKCSPPCICHWKSKFYNTDMVLSVLLQSFPQKYKQGAHNMNIKFRRSGPVSDLGLLRAFTRLTIKNAC